MARQLRVQFEGAIYHVCARGDRREKIVLDEEDCRRMEEMWEEIVSKTRWRVFAWIIMGNHYHAVFQTPEPNLVEGMKWVQNTWTRRFNARHAQWGHVFGDRYKSVVCENGDYLQRLIDYVHFNSGAFWGQSRVFNFWIISDKYQEVLTDPKSYPSYDRCRKYHCKPR